MKTAFLVIFWAIIAIATFVWVFSNFDPSAMSVHGWIALIGGSVLSLLVGGGLMALAFYSQRAGYDARMAPEEWDDGEDGERDGR